MACGPLFEYLLASGAIVIAINGPELIRMIDIHVVGQTHDADEEFFTDYHTGNFNLRVKVRNLNI